MRNSKFILFCSMIFLFISVNLFAQGGLSESATETVTISLKKGLQISDAGGDLAFEEVLVGTATSVAKSPDQGAKFLVTGTTGAVTVSYSNVTLTNGSDDLTFTPEVVTTGANASYSGATTVNNGDTPSISNEGGSGEGNLYLWVGGSIDVDALASQGNYSVHFH